MNDPIPALPEGLLSTLRTLSQSAIGRRVCERIHRSTIDRAGNLRLCGETYRIYPAPDNASVAELVARHPSRFWAWIFLNPKHDPRALDELTRWRALPGMIGIKLHPHWHDYELELLFPLLQHVETRRLPVLIHLGYGRNGRYRPLVERFPKLPFVFAHAGVPFYRELWSFARTHDNVHVDLSSPYLDERLAREAVRVMGSERCLYGTDSPYGFPEADHSYDYGEIRGWVERMPLSLRAAEDVLGGNLMRLVASTRAS